MRAGALLPVTVFAIALGILGRVTRICGVPERARALHEEMLAITRERASFMTGSPMHCARSR